MDFSPYALREKKKEKEIIITKINQEVISTQKMSYPQFQHIKNNAGVKNKINKRKNIKFLFISPVISPLLCLTLTKNLKFLLDHK